MRRIILLAGLFLMATACEQATQPIDSPLSEIMNTALGPACIAPPPGMVSWWPGDGDGTDIQVGNNGALINGAGFATGYVGQAFSFDGTNDYLFVGNPANLQLTQGVTIDAWVFFPQDLAEGQQASIAGKWGFTVGTDAYVLTTIKGSGVIRLVFAVGDNATGDGGLRAGAIAPNTWTHVAGTYDAATGSNVLYVNGVDVGSRIRPGGIHSSAQDVIIGAQDRADGVVWRFFPGLIDEIEIFNRALSAQEIANIFNAGSAGKCKLLTPEEEIQAILDAILADEDLNGNVAGALVSKLENVIAKLDKGNVNAAINQLQAFINQVEALIQAGQLTQQDGDLLIDAAQSVIDQLSA